MPDSDEGVHTSMVTPGSHKITRSTPTGRNVVARIAGPSTLSASDHQAVDYELVTKSEVCIGEPKKNADLVLAAFELAEALESTGRDPVEAIRELADEITE